jgi:transposase
MPKPIPVPVRQKLWERASQGESVASLATSFGLSPRTVRHLLKRCREHGDPGLIPGYRTPSPPDHAYSEEVREAVLARRRDHPTWGAELIRLMLADARPQVAWPTPQTIRRWFRTAGLAHALAGRRPGSASARATHPHQTWQIDASEHIPLADKSEVCWLRIVDEATGSVLRTDVFPPRVLDPGRSARSPNGLEAFVPEMGSARATARRQRRALGVSGGPAHGPGLLAGGAGRRGEGQSAALPSGQRRGRAVAGGGQAVVRALDVRIERRVGAAAGRDGPRAAGALSDRMGAVPPGVLSGPGALGPVVRPGSRRDLVGPSEGVGVGGLAPRAASGGSRGQAFGVQPAVQRGRGVGRPNGVGGFRSGGRAMDVPGRARARNSSPSGEGIEPRVGLWAGSDPSAKGSPCGYSHRSVIVKNAHSFDQFTRYVAKPTVRINAAKPTVR